jgi:hypothetical protein
MFPSAVHKGTLNLPAVAQELFRDVGVENYLERAESGERGLDRGRPAAA